MVTADDIQAFEESNEAAIQAANEYKRRAEKGLPADRFADGTEGAILVGRGIAAYQAIMAMQSAAIVDLFAAMQAAGSDAMQIHSEHSKYR